MKTASSTFLCFKLKFKSGLHLSRGRPARDMSQETLRSDTLKSAIFSALVRLGEQPDEAFLQSFSLTSAFPFVGASNFFPIPLLGARLVANDGGHKLLKRLRYVDQSIFEQLLRGESVELGKDNLSEDGKLAVSSPTTDQIKNAFVRGMRQQVTLRETQDNPYGIAHENTPTPFFVEELHCAADAGLWFMADLEDGIEGEAALKLNAAMRYLADEGLGSARSRGLGDFSFTASAISLSLPTNPTHHVALGLYCPIETALTDSRLAASAWELIRREGFIASSTSAAATTLRRPSLHMFVEGSTFQGAAPQGALHDLWPKTEHGVSRPHPIWRDGRPLWLPLYCPTPIQ